MSSQYTADYFDRNLKRLLGLRHYVMRHAVNNVTNSTLAAVIKDGMKIKGLSGKEELRETINRHFGGLQGIRTTPFWKIHFKMALAIFNTRLQIVKNEKMVNILADKNPMSLLMKLLDPEIQFEISKSQVVKLGSICSTEQSCKNKQTNLEDYKICCVFLRRIPTLNRDEVKQLYAFILECMINKYNKKHNAERNHIDVQTVLEIFNNNYNGNLRDLGPACEMADDFQAPEALLEIRQVWENFETEMPILLPRAAPEHQLSPSPQTSEFSGRPDSHRHSLESSDDEPVSSPSERSSRKRSRSKSSTRSWNSSSTQLMSSPEPLRSKLNSSACDCATKEADLDQREQILEEEWAALTEERAKLRAKKHKLMEMEETLAEEEASLGKRIKTCEEREKSLDVRRNELADRESRQIEREIAQNARENFQNRREMQLDEVSKDLFDLAMSGRSEQTRQASVLRRSWDVFSKLWRFKKS